MRVVIIVCKSGGSGKGSGGSGIGGTYKAFFTVNDERRGKEAISGKSDNAPGDFRSEKHRNAEHGRKKKSPVPPPLTGNKGGNKQGDGEG